MQLDKRALLTGDAGCVGSLLSEEPFSVYRRQHCRKVKVAAILKTYRSQTYSNKSCVVSRPTMEALRDRDAGLLNSLIKRSFCYLADLIDLFMSMMATRENNIGPVFMGNPHDFKVREHAKTIIAIMGSSSKAVHRLLPSAVSKQTQPHVPVARYAIGGQPFKASGQGLKKVIAYFEFYPQKSQLIGVCISSSSNFVSG